MGDFQENFIFCTKRGVNLQFRSPIKMLKLSSIGKGNELKRMFEKKTFHIDLYYNTLSF